MEFTQSFVLKGLGLHDLKRARCHSCGHEFQKGDPVVRRGQRDHRRYYHKECFEKLFH